MSTRELLQRGITPKIHADLLDANPDCHYCGSLASEVDHVIPRSRGGGLDPENLVSACYSCNREKRDLTPDEWAEWRVAQGKPWPVPSLSHRILLLLRDGVMPNCVASTPEFGRHVTGRESGAPAVTLVSIEKYVSVLQELRDRPEGDRLGALLRSGGAA